MICLDYRPLAEALRLIRQHCAAITLKSLMDIWNRS